MRVLAAVLLAIGVSSVVGADDIQLVGGGKISGEIVERKRPEDRGGDRTRPRDAPHDSGDEGRGRRAPLSPTFRERAAPPPTGRRRPGGSPSGRWAASGTSSTQAREAYQRALALDPGERRGQRRPWPCPGGRTVAEPGGVVSRPGPRALRGKLGHPGRAGSGPPRPLRGRACPNAPSARPTRGSGRPRPAPGRRRPRPGGPRQRPPLQEPSSEGIPYWPYGYGGGGAYWPPGDPACCRPDPAAPTDARAAGSKAAHHQPERAGRGQGNRRSGTPGGPRQEALTFA